MFQENAEVVDHKTIASKTHLIRLHCPKIAALIRPGQFVMIKLQGGNDPLLGRPFALYDTTFDEQGEISGIEIVYLEIGKMTSLLPSIIPGQSIEIWGPLGKPFPIFQDNAHVAFIAGGIGQTPFLAFGKQLLGIKAYGGDLPLKSLNKITMIYGVRNSSFLAGVDHFVSIGLNLFCATDDGSFGFHGRVTELLKTLPKVDHWYGCGPEPMLHALCKLALEQNIPCHVSLESPMACGLGICFSCVVKVKAEDGWDYKRICVDGPIFNAESLVLD